MNLNFGVRRLSNGDHPYWILGAIDSLYAKSSRGGTPFESMKGQRDAPCTSFGTGIPEASSRVGYKSIDLTCDAICIPAISVAGVDRINGTWTA